MRIRPGRADDVDGVTTIFNHYIANSHARFETEPFSIADRQAWMSVFGATGPHRLFVAEDAAGVQGFAAAQPYRAGPAFAATVEVSVYLAADRRARGLGVRLYATLFEALAAAPVHRALAGIALPNDASIALHRRFGFRDVGVFSEYALKNGRYISSLWMEKTFDEGT